MRNEIERELGDLRRTRPLRVAKWLPPERNDARGLDSRCAPRYATRCGRAFPAPPSDVLGALVRPSADASDAALAIASGNRRPRRADAATTSAPLLVQGRGRAG